MAFKPRQPMNPETARLRLADMCAKAEHCRFELSEKLKNWMVPSLEAEKILDELEDKRFFSDARFAEIYARHKAVYGRWGRRKISMGLFAKRISSSVIKDALDNIEEDVYRQTMIDVLRSKARQIKEGNTFEGRTKLYRFGVSRGYEPNLVAAAIKAGILFDPESDK